MKKLYTISVLLLALVSKSFSQNPGFKKDDFFIGGTLGGSSFVTKDTDNISFNLGTKLGYFVSNKTAVGISLGYNSDRLFFASAFVRRYYSPDKQFSIFTDLSITYFKSVYENNNSNGSSLALAPGVSYFINNDLAIESSVGLLSYSFAFAQESGAATTQNFDLSLNLKQINIGLICKF